MTWKKYLKALNQSKEKNNKSDGEFKGDFRILDQFLMTCEW